MKIQTEVIPGADYMYLCCPSCGERELYQFSVEVFVPKEQGLCEELAIHILGSDVMPIAMALNPSKRQRQAVRIFFNCEQCCEISSLSIWQHAGATLMAQEMLRNEHNDGNKDSE